MVGDCTHRLISNHARGFVGQSLRFDSSGVVALKELVDPVLGCVVGELRC
jgi:hypothetical protein